ncbi:MAG: head-tail connector protein [Desulfitobacterium sp.]
MILTPQEAASVLKIDSSDDFPELNIWLPGVEDCIKTATGRDWGAYTPIDPTAKILACVLIARWFDDPGLIGKVDFADKSVVALVGQLHAKALVAGDG